MPPSPGWSRMRGDGQRPEAFTSLGSLTFEEKAILTALSDEFMSASVIKIRAGHASTGRVDIIRSTCRKLERLGLAEHAGSGRRSTSRWRRSQRGAERDPASRQASAVSTPSI